MQFNINNILESLLSRIEKEGYGGYDPWDGLNSKFVDSNSSKFLKLLIFHLNSHSPFNLRPFLGVKKTVNAKGLALMIETYINLFVKYNKDIYLEKIEKLVMMLLKLRSESERNLCWGYPFPWETPHRSLDKYSPNVVTTGFIVRSLDKYLNLVPRKTIKTMILSCSQFVIDDLNMHTSKEGICFSYTPRDTYQVINASLLATEILSCAYKIKKDKKIRNLCELSLKFVFYNQRDDGSWDYALTHKTGLGLEKGGPSQVDWHQGFVLDSIYNINKNIGNDFSHIREPFVKGINFYKRKQFTEQGQSYWRWPRLWPADIHNQSQGVITFSKYQKYDSELGPLSDRILDWTLKNLYSRSDYFYFRKWPFLTIKVPYMRYSQIWMANALSFYINGK